MDKSQGKTENVGSLLSEFYEIIDQDLFEDRPKKLSEPPQQSSLENKVHKIVDSEDESPENNASQSKHIKSFEVQSEGQREDKIQQSGRQSNSMGNKFLYTCSTQALSRRRYWEEEHLRSILEKRQSEEGSLGSSNLKEQLAKINKSQSSKNIDILELQKRPTKFTVEDELNPSPWKNNQSNNFIYPKISSHNTSHSKASEKKRRKGRKPEKTQLMVNLEYGEGKKRKYLVGMRDLNKEWFKILDSIHKKK